VITTANICSDENDSKVDMKNDEGWLGFVTQHQHNYSKYSI
jgi:hypothetical protein